MKCFRLTIVKSLTILTWFCSLTAFKILISLKAFEVPKVYSEEQNKSFFLNFSLKWWMITNNLQCDICVLTCIGKPCPWGSISNLNFFSATLSPVSFIVALKTTPKVPLPTTFSISIPRSDRMSVGKALVKKRSAVKNREWTSAQLRTKHFLHDCTDEITKLADIGRLRFLHVPAIAIRATILPFQAHDDGFHNSSVGNPDTRSVLRFPAIFLTQNYPTKNLIVEEEGSKRDVDYVQHSSVSQLPMSRCILRSADWLKISAKRFMPHVQNVQNSKRTSQTWNSWGSEKCRKKQSTFNWVSRCFRRATFTALSLHED